ncbi:hypothetical protein DPEC_G00173270 [Dallia pectoralis]|uniref:Uncharacterized protein n=1 Tax=Dallia pectoralis TaxID=75939 RepID=A0ACC2GEA4_DALPE|nr:hypothetical protein DPEC_G00173270 [Dallia pectoralis]
MSLLFIRVIQARITGERGQHGYSPPPHRSPPSPLYGTSPGPQTSRPCCLHLACLGMGQRWEGHVAEDGARLSRGAGPPFAQTAGVKGQHGPLDISYDNALGCVISSPKLPDTLRLLARSNWASGGKKVPTARRAENRFELDGARRGQDHGAAGPLTPLAVPVLYLARRKRGL